MFVVDFEDYKEAMDEKLKNRFVGKTGEEKDIRCSEKEIIAALHVLSKEE